MVPSFLSILVLAAGYWLGHLAARSPDRRCGWHGVWRVACLIGTVRICALWLGAAAFRNPGWLQGFGYFLQMPSVGVYTPDPSRPEGRSG